ncbi:MAG: GAF domain-containing protein [Flavobacteriaceae bacterium]|nr:GAF domain-containing protein [Flavobacteriaceae bacterium]
MHNHSIPTNLTKEEKYRQLLPQLEAIVAGETDVIANMANVTAALKEAFGWWWVGFYLVKEMGTGSGKQGDGSRRIGDETLTTHNPQLLTELVLGPFQGPIACTRIALGKGVCGTAWQDAKTIIVPDVDLFPGHIACSGASKSEIVVPVFHPSLMGRGSVEVIAVLDVDSEFLNHFDEVDKEWLEQICGLPFGVGH